MVTYERTFYSTLCVVCSAYAQYTSVRVHVEDGAPTYVCMYVCVTSVLVILVLVTSVCQ